MDEVLDELYLHWLYGQIGSVRTRDKTKTYWSLARTLFRKEFVWFVPNDDNRVEDGKDLRLEFRVLNDMDEIDPDWMNMGCSMLEMMIALSRRLAFEAEGEPREWFWELIDNLDIYFSDAHFNKKNEDKIDEVLDRVIWRQYKRNGKGGLFPLKESRRDQTDVEIWYQLNDYILER